MRELLATLIEIDRLVKAAGFVEQRLAHPDIQQHLRTESTGSDGSV
jgi:hypothetical protein